MNFEYGFDDPIINIIIIGVLWIWLVLGTYIYSKLIYFMYHSEYKKDPQFKNIPTALRWKMVLVILTASFLLGPPYVSLLVLTVLNILYILWPITLISTFTIYSWFVFLLLLVMYLLYARKYVENAAYKLIKQGVEYEKYFRSNAKAWGVINAGEDITMEAGYYDKTAVRLAQIGLHLGLIPITLIVILNLFSM
jgi:hypothetical protein